MKELRYPIGEFIPKEAYSLLEIRSAIQKIENFPNELKAQLAKLSKEQLKESYRPGGWTGIQVVHHIADSHINAYIRTKFALVNDKTPIMGYEESAWAATPEIEQVDIEVSVDLLSALHARWVGILKNMKEVDFQNSYRHSQYNSYWKLEKVVHLYAWHGAHHIAHLSLLEK